MTVHGLAGVEAAKTSVGAGGVIIDPGTDTVTVSASNFLVANTRMGWTSVHSQTRNSTTKAIIGAASVIQNQHLIGFGSNVDPQPGAGASYAWSFMDSTFGYPTQSSGYFSSAPAGGLCLTACGAPPHMRVPKSGLPWDPQGVRSGAQLTSLSDYSPPHSSWFSEYADLIAAFMVRYPHVKYVQVWNELKGFYFTTQYPGSNLVPTGSGLPAGSGNNNRWWYEGYTAMYNLIWQKVKAVRPDAFIVGPYNVLNSLAWTGSTDWADDAFPMNYHGPWGYGDKKVMTTLVYFVANCVGTDALAVDIRNLTKDGGVTNYYNPSSIPAAPDPTNQFLSNPEGGVNARFWLEGQADGAWNNGRKVNDFVTWLRALGASSAAYQRPVCDARSVPVWVAEWYCYEDRNQFKMPNPATGNYYVEQYSSHQGEACAFAWQYLNALEAGIYALMAWKPEGSVQGNMNDPGDSNPLALYFQNGSPLSLQKTALAPVNEGIVNHFPAGTQMKVVTSTTPLVRGCASASKIMLCNRSKTPTSVTLIDAVAGSSVPVTLAGHEVRFIDR